MISQSSRRLRVLDFDIENRPLTYLGDDFTFGETTAIGWKFVGEPSKYQVRILGYRCQHQRDAEGNLCGVYHNGCSQLTMLSDFLEAYTEADMVTGHNILGHDLLNLNGSLLELGLPPLPARLVSDTNFHLGKRKNVSKSQENLAAMLGVPSPKVGMSQHKWRGANRLDLGGMVLTRRRVLGDVRQHIQLRQKLIELGWLGAPIEWKPKR